MKYKLGFFGGSFDPLHIGHIHDIIRAASVCERLFVIISYCEGRESVAKDLIYRWIHYSTMHLHNIKIFTLEDTASTKEAYNSDYYWEKGANDIKKLIRTKIDVVFCGSDYWDSNRFESLYGSDSEVIYFDRSEVPISSTELRFCPYKHWEYLPPICRPYYAKRILITGSESTGKSTLTQNLALAYNTNFVPEIGRDVCFNAGGEDFMNQDDLVEILIRQKAAELDALLHSNRLLFVDTDALSTKFYAQFLLKQNDEIKQCSALADAISNLQRFALIFFLEPSTEFVQDGTRSEEIAKHRDKYSMQLKSLFYENKLDLISLSGSYLQRFDKAKEVIAQRLGIKTIW
ncbi:MAG: AAA family ATPase [Bradymonadales bacterium]